MKIVCLSLLVATFAKLSTVDGYNYNDSEYDEYTNKFSENSGKCTPDLFFDYVSNNLFPDDYEELKNSDIKFSVKHINESFAIFRRLKQYAQNVSEKLQPIMKRVMPRITDLLLQIDLPVDCMVSLARIGQAAQEGHHWALKFMDSNPPLIKSGLIEGQIGSFGDYDGCLAIRSPVEIDKPVITGKFCPFNIKLPFPSEYTPGEPIDNSLTDMIAQYVNSSEKLANIMNYRALRDRDTIVKHFLFFRKAMDNLKMNTIGICLPNNCNAKDIENAVNSAIYPITRIPMEVDSDCDYLEKPIKLDGHSYISMAIVMILLLLAIISTIIELVVNQLPNTEKSDTFSMKLAKSFSILTNIKTAFIKEATNPRFGCLDGIRAIASFNVFVIHSVLLTVMLAFQLRDIRSSIAIQVMTEFKYILIRNVNLNTLFFLIGGMMSAYVMLSKLEKKEKFNYFEFVVHRYIKTNLPVFASFTFIILLQHTGDGPFWKSVMRLVTYGCYRNLHSSALMVSNYKLSFDYPPCNYVTWYTSTDFQLSLFAPILVIVLYRFGNYGAIFNVFLIILSCFVSVLPKLFVPLYFEYNKLDSIDQFVTALVHYHYGVEINCGSFVLGMFIGYLIRYKPNLNFGGKYGELLIWLITASFTVWGTVWHKDFFKPEHMIGEIEVYIWIAFAKFFFVAGFVWTIYACATGRGGFVNKFLCWKGFKFFSNISFEFFLVHTIPIFYRAAKSRQLVRVDDYYALTTGAFDFTMAIVLALIFRMLVTAPFVNVFTLVTKGEHQKPLKQISNGCETERNDTKA